MHQKPLYLSYAAPKDNTMKKVYSARRSFIRYFSLMLAIVLVLFLAFGAYSGWTYDQQLRYCTDSALELYRSSLTSVTERMRSFNEKISADSQDFRMLTLDTLSGSSRITMRLHLKELADSSVPDDGLILMCDESGWLQYSFGSRLLRNGMLTEDLIATAHQLRDASLGMEENEAGKWTIVETDGRVFLCNVYFLLDQRVCSAIELNSFSSGAASSSDGSIRLLFYHDGVFLTERALASEKGLVPSDASETGGLRSGYVLASASLNTLGLGFLCMMPVRGIWQYSGVSFIILGIIALVCVVVFLSTYRLMNDLVIYPLRQVSEVSRQLSSVVSGDAPLPQEQNRVEELNVLRESLNDLALQKVNLQKKSDETETEKEHALLQYYQLQTRSHFFLNCLKSLYGMLETGDHARMKTMIIAFSNHLRFIFHDNLTLVPLRAEIDEVRDYHRIISMDSRQPILLSQDISPGAEECLVPPLIIQTFLENSYKYNGRGRDVLQFSIRIDRIEYEGSSRIRIRLGDDGLGYDEETLSWLNGRPAPEIFSQYHVGISNLRRRMSILYDDDYELAFFNGPSGGANILISIPAREEGDEQS